MRVVSMLNHTPNKFNRRLIKKLSKMGMGDLPNTKAYRVRRMSRHYKMIDEVSEFDEKAANALLKMLRIKDNNLSMSYADRIDCAFLWDKTNEGEAYWHKVHNQLQLRRKGGSGLVYDFDLF